MNTVQKLNMFSLAILNAMAGFIWYAGLMFDTYDLNKLKKYSQEKGRQLKKNIKPRENVESKKKCSQENVVQEKILPREMYMLEEKKR